MSRFLTISDDPQLARCEEVFCATCGCPLNPDGYHADADAAWWSSGRARLPVAWCSERCAEDHDPVPR